MYLFYKYQNEIVRKVTETKSNLPCLFWNTAFSTPLPDYFLDSFAKGSQMCLKFKDGNSFIYSC